MKSTVGHYVTLGCGKLKNGSERKNQNQQHVCCKRCDKHQLAELKMVMSGVEDGTDVSDSRFPMEQLTEQCDCCPVCTWNTDTGQNKF